jgi:diaminopimelate epimerase
MPPLVLPFTKMHGAGNDFLVLDNRFFHLSGGELAALARRYCRRRFGVGADGLLALDPPEAGGHHYRMRYHNADGTLAGMCGNGARCLARFARMAGLTAEPLVFGSDAGTYTAWVPEDPGGPVRLEVPPPEGFREAVPLAEGGTVPYIWTGTHHAVVFVEDVDDADPGREGPALRHDPAFRPEGTNVNFVEVEGPDRVRIRTFEKGVEAETLACGTGALAAAVVAHLTGRVSDRPVTVEARGGTLAVGFKPEGSGVRDLTLEGPAEAVFSGTLEVDPRWLASEASG